MKRTVTEKISRRLWLCAMTCMIVLLPAVTVKAEVVYQDDQVTVSVEEQTGHEDEAAFVTRVSEDDIDDLPASALSASAVTADTSSASSSGMWMYGDHLSGNTKVIYDAAVASMIPHGKVVITEKKTASKDQYDIIYEYMDCYLPGLFAFKCDYPERMDWSCDTLAMSWEWDDTSVTMNFYYDGSAYYTDTLHKKMQSEADRLAEKVKAAKTSELGRLQYLHDYLVKANTYDYDSSVDEDFSEKRFYSHSPYGCLFMGTGVCASYTLAFKLVCDRLDIPCIFVRGDGHSWDYVLRNDGKWYMIDCTWDDNDLSTVDRTYFLVGNRPYQYGHNEDGLFERPVTVWQAATPKVPTLSNTTSGVKITWEETDGVYQYRVYRKVSGGSFKKLKDTYETSYVDNTAESGKVYYYSIAALDGGGTRISAYNSTGKSIRYLAPVLSSSLSLTNWKSGMSVKWKKITGCEGYYVYRRTPSGTYNKIGEVTGADTLTYLDKTAANGTLYYYSVRAYKGSTLGSYQGKKTMRLETPVFKSLESATSRTMVARWAANEKAVSYQLQYASDSGFTKDVKSVTMTSATTLRKTITDLTAGRTIYVRVRAYGKDGDTKYYSGWSEVKNVKIHA